MEKWAADPTRHLAEGAQMESKRTERCPMPQATREPQSRTTRDCHTPTSTAPIQTPTAPGPARAGDADGAAT